MDSTTALIRAALEEAGTTGLSSRTHDQLIEAGLPITLFLDTDEDKEHSDTYAAE